MSCSSISRRHRTGLEALPELERVAPDAKVIILSGFAAPIVDDDLGHWVAGYVQKGVEST
jgi:DNA-binding NarL/FixJ family response regulator